MEHPTKDLKLFPNLAELVPAETMLDKLPSLDEVNGWSGTGYDTRRDDAVYDVGVLDLEGALVFGDLSGVGTGADGTTSQMNQFICESVEQSSDEWRTCPDAKVQEDTHEMTVKMADPEHRDTYESKEMSNKPVTSDRKKHDDLEPKPGEELVDLLGGGTRAGAALMAKQSRKHKSKPDGDAAKDERSVTDIQRSLDGTTASAAAYKKKHDGNDGPDRP